MNGRLISLKNVLQTSSMLLEKDLFKYFSYWYLNQKLDSLKNKSVLSMLNCLGPRIRNSLLMQASLLQQKSQSEHLRWKKKTNLGNVSFSLCIKNWIVPKFKKCLFSWHMNMLKPLFLHAYKIYLLNEEFQPKYSTCIERFIRKIAQWCLCY